jgi:colanic acid biosynthesis glycosyl transferase WcaI
MNILIITQYFWPENFRINDLAAGLTEKGHTITVLTGVPNYPGGRFFSGYGLFKNRVQEHQGTRIIRVPLVPRGTGQRLNLMLNYLSFAFFASLLGLIYCRQKYDVIFVYEPSPITVGIPALVLKVLQKTPIMFWVQDLWPESLVATNAVHSRYILRWVDRLVRLIYRACDTILIQSRAFREPIEKHGVDVDRIRYFPNSAEDLYRPVAKCAVPECAHIPEGFYVMFAGNIGAAQNFDTILDAAEQLKEYRDIHWIIIGDGRMLKWVEDEIRKRDLSKTMHLLGRHPAESMPAFFSIADALLVSLRKEPIFALTIPAKVQSYLASAKPIIAALDGEGARIIEEAGAGLVCEPGNAEALAKAVVALHDLPVNKRQALGRQGRDYFEDNFNRNLLLDRLDQWMEALHRKG